MQTVVNSLLTRTPLPRTILRLPDFLEIRATAGTPPVFEFQLQFGSKKFCSAICPMLTVAMNPAALKTNIDDLPEGGCWS